MRYPTTPDKCDQHQYLPDDEKSPCTVCKQRVCSNCGTCGCNAVQVVTGIVVDVLVDTVKKRIQTMESNDDKDPDDIADSGNNIVGS